MVRNSLALLFAVRCRSEDGVKQLLGRFWHTMGERESRTFMNRTIMLLEPRERDWLKSLC